MAESDSKMPPPPAPPTFMMIQSYKFDTWYCSEPTAQYQVLAWVNVFCVVLLMFLFTITGSLADRSGFDFWAEMAWMSWGQLFDGVGGSPDGELWGTRAVGLVNTFMGMFVFGLVCAFVEDAINCKMEALRRGKTKVLEEGFDLIIGWNARILPLVSQLCLANESDGGGAVVILAEMDKPEMDDFWMSEISIEDRLGTKIITREGDSITPLNLNKVSAKQASSIVILSPAPHMADESDAAVTRTMLALTGALGEVGEDGITGHVVLSLCDIDNLPYCSLAVKDRKKNDTYIKPVVAHDLTGRLMIQCAMEPGLSRIFAHILAFEYNEFYFKNFPELGGRRFADVCFMFEDAVPFGVFFGTPQVDPADPDKLIKLVINPPGDYYMEADDMVIVIAEDDDSFEPANQPNLKDPGECPDFPEPEKQTRSILLIGFRRDLDDMINEIDEWMAPGSTLTSFARGKVEDRIDILMEGGLDAEFDNMKLVHLEGNPVVQKHLEEKLDIPSYDAIIVLTESLDEDGEPLIPLNCDSRTLVTTLLIRDIQRRAGVNKTLVCEILDPRTEKLLALADLDDYLSTNDLVSMALAQCAKERRVHRLINTIFCPEGNEMHVKDIRRYAVEGETLNFWELTARARMHGEVVLGFFRKDIGKGKTPILNPGNESQKDDFPGDKNTRMVWTYGDQLIVFSED